MGAIPKGLKSEEVENYSVGYTTISATNTVRIVSQYDNYLLLSLEAFFCPQSEFHTIQDALSISRKQLENAASSWEKVRSMRRM